MMQPQRLFCCCAFVPLCSVAQMDASPLPVKRELDTRSAVSPSVSSVAASPVAAIATAVGDCKKCLRPVESDDCKAKGSERSKSVEHKQCAATFKALTRRWSKKNALKCMWEAKSDDDKVQWFVENTPSLGDHGDQFGDSLVNSLSQVNKHGVKRKLTTDGEIVESQSESSKRRVQDIGLNWNKWSEKELMLRSALGLDPKRIMAELKDEWKLLLLKEDVDKEMVNGEWCIYEFAGVLRERVSSQSTTSHKRVKSSIENNDDKELLDGIVQSALSKARESFEQQRLAVHRPRPCEIGIPMERPAFPFTSRWLPAPLRSCQLRPFSWCDVRTRHHGCDGHLGQTRMKCVPQKRPSRAPPQCWQVSPPWPQSTSPGHNSCRSACASERHEPSIEFIVWCVIG